MLQGEKKNIGSCLCSKLTYSYPVFFWRVSLVWTSLTGIHLSTLLLPPPPEGKAEKYSGVLFVRYSSCWIPFLSWRFGSLHTYRASEQWEECLSGSGAASALLLRLSSALLELFMTSVRTVQAATPCGEAHRRSDVKTFRQKGDLRRQWQFGRQSQTMTQLVN